MPEGRFAVRVPAISVVAAVICLSAVVAVTPAVAAAPSASTFGSDNITPSGARVTGLIVGDGEPTTYRFQYGLTDSYGSQTPDKAGPSSGTQGVVETITGLAPDTIYHYRLTASSASGTGEGVDRTFRTLPAGATAILDSNAPPTRADPYPATEQVDGLSGAIADVNITLEGLSHPRPDDIDLVLVAPDGDSVELISDAGGAQDASGVTLTLNDEVPTALPDDGPLTSGTFRPGDFGAGGDSYPAPAPAGALSSLSAFDGGDPNGTWRLFAVDDTNVSSGSINDWSLEIDTTDTATPPDEPTGLTAFLTHSATGDVALDWDDMQEAESYRVSVYLEGGAVPEFPAATPIVSSHTVSPLRNGISYCFDVSAVNSVGESEAARICATPVAAPLVWGFCGARDCVEVNQDGTMVTLHSFVSPNGLATSALFEYGKRGREYRTAVTEISPAEFVGIAVGDIPTKSLEAGESYRYNVFAVNAQGGAEGERRTFTAPGTALKKSQTGDSVKASHSLLAPAARLTASLDTSAKASGKRRVQVGKLVKRNLAAGTVPLRVKLNAEGRQALERLGKLGLRLRISVKPKDGGPTVRTTNKVTLTG